MNIDPETRNGYYISPEMKQIWAVEMKLLNKLLEVCKKHNLRIWAEGGTLLGAVREHGYIPWDDDIDMAMLREDYDKLREIAKEDFNAPFFFQCGYTDIFPHGQTKIRIDGTSAILKGDIYQNFHQGIFIDIFPLDIIPSDERTFREFKGIRSKMKKNLELYCKHYFSFSNLKQNIMFLKVYCHIKRIGFCNYFKLYDELVKKYSKKDFKNVSIISWSAESKYIRERSWYKETLYIPFEDIMIPIPSGYHEILSKQYGDYLSPVKEVNQHGDFAILDPNRHYKVLLPSLRKEHRWDLWKIRWNNTKKRIKKLIHK